MVRLRRKVYENLLDKFTTLFSKITKIFNTEIDKNANISDFTNLVKYIEDNTLVKLDESYLKQTDIMASTDSYMSLLDQALTSPGSRSWKIYNPSENVDYVLLGDNLCKIENNNLILIKKLSRSNCRPVKIGDCIYYGTRNVYEYNLKTDTISSITPVSYDNMSSRTHANGLSISLMGNCIYYSKVTDTFESKKNLSIIKFDLATKTSSTIFNVGNFRDLYLIQSGLVKDKYAYFLYQIYNYKYFYTLGIVDLSKNRYIFHDDVKRDTGGGYGNDAVMSHPLLVGDDLIFGAKFLSSLSFSIPDVRDNIYCISTNGDKKSLEGNEEFYRNLIFNKKYEYELLSDNICQMLNKNKIIADNTLYDLNTKTYKADIFKLKSICNFVNSRKKIGQITTSNGCAGIVVGEEMLKSE
ncbi:hypothetical protein [Peptostreptococcus anaerobius]|uniref:Uncharacterized protein n=1 Tax=Peptostreptococcus anaerobius TaxID=1261 RepID=A0A135YQ32_9FIRM|nr:hypothetical protein [Peptostreptococcus anaerobius]KXI11484.1 hypothetical protein HMPREF3195_01389 [Peptostreptococcus anaerobius]